MIMLEKVGKTFADKKVLTNISFTIKEGEIIGLLGPNGAGKTTTMRLIVGYLKPSQGKVIVGGQRPQWSRTEILRKIGYLPENNPLYHEMKVKEYLSFIAGVKNQGDADLTKILRSVGLEEFVNRPIEELSRGYKQRVGLAAAIIAEPQILILDEPTSGLDPIEQEKIRRLIKDLGRQKTIILSTHILSEVEEVATRLIIIDRGVIVYDGVKPKKKGDVERLFKKLVKG